MGNIEYLKIKNYSDYKKLVENIENLCSDKRPLVVIPELLSNVEEEEITINIANTLALKENKILIIDCNFRNLNTYEQFDISNNFGLYEVLVEDINVEDIIVNIDNNLDILTSGTKRLNLVDLLTANKLKSIVVYLKEFYDYIILDMPETFTEYGHILNEIKDVILFGREN